MLEHCWGDLFPFSHRALMRSGTDVGQLGLARIRCCNSSQRCSMGLRSWLCADQSSSSTPILTNDFCMDLALCTGALSCWNRKRPSQNCCHNVGSTESSRMSLYAVVLIFPYTVNKGPSPNHEKQPHKKQPQFLHQTYSWHYAFGQVALYWHLPNPDSSVGLPDGEAWFITPENAFPLLASFTPLQPCGWNSHIY
jgi:hypothetical protein